MINVQKMINKLIIYKNILYLKMSTNQITQKEIEDARKKFNEMYSNVKLGGKGNRLNIDN